MKESSRKVRSRDNGDSSTLFERDDEKQTTLDLGSLFDFCWIYFRFEDEKAIFVPWKCDFVIYTIRSHSRSSLSNHLLVCVLLRVLLLQAKRTIPQQVGAPGNYIFPVIFCTILCEMIQDSKLHENFNIKNPVCARRSYMIDCRFPNDGSSPLEWKIIQKLQQARE